MGSEDFKKRFNQLKEEREEIISNKNDLDVSINIDAETNRIKKELEEINRVRSIAINSRSILRDLDEQFEMCTGLNKRDIKFLFLATALQVLRQYLLTNFKPRLKDDAAAQESPFYHKTSSNRQHELYKPSLNEIWTNPVPFDANVGANGALSGGGQLGHRLTSLGHDPLIGLVVGTSNIATSTLTNNKFQSYHIKTGTISNGAIKDVFGERASTPLVFGHAAGRVTEGLEGVAIVVSSLILELMHLYSDLNSINSLPLPGLSVVSPKTANELAKRGLDMGNVVKVGEQAAFSVMVNLIVSTLHTMFYDESEMDRKLYEVKTRKIIMYSNTIASVSNIIAVAVGTIMGKADSVRYLDIGGLIVTLYRISKDKEFIQQVKKEFIENEFRDMVMGEDA